MTKLTALIACAAIALAAPAFALTNTTAPAKKPSMLGNMVSKMKAKPASTSAMAAKPAAATATAPKMATTTAPAATKGPAKTQAKTPEGKACSAQADAQNLHGAARKSFRSKCKEAAAKAAPAKA